MAPPEPCYPTTASPGYPNTVEARENNFNTNFTKIEVLKEEIKKFLKKLKKRQKDMWDTMKRPSLRITEIDLFFQKIYLTKS